MTTKEIGSKMKSENSYGQNASPTPSSVPISESDGLSSVKATPDDAVRDIVASNGVADQTRKLPRSNVPAHDAMQSPKSTSTLPPDRHPVLLKQMRKP